VFPEFGTVKLKADPYSAGFPVATLQQFSGTSPFWKAEFHLAVLRNGWRGLMNSGWVRSMADLNSLVIFAKVVEAKGFSEAARRLKMPTSTVSRRVADLEKQLGVRLIERSTRSLRLTDVGSEVFEYARHGWEISEAVHKIASNHTSTLSGELRLASPPSISDCFLAPLIGAFQASYPDVRVQVLITERVVDQIAERVDLAFRVQRQLEDSSLVARKILTYRHQLVTSPAYLAGREPPQNPPDLLQHRLLAFSFWKPISVWTFVNGTRKETLTFHPQLCMNDYTGLAAALVAGTGIGDLPPLVQPELLREGRLVEVMPKWHFRLRHLWMVHLSNRCIARPVRVFKDFAVQMAPKLFPTLPT
jgi:DNA-binding transcriptional LysR family regulator